MSFLERLWYSPNPGALGQLAKVPLLLPSLGFAAASNLRSRLYDRGTLGSERVEGLRVLSVGNLNVGGTGKTPVTIHLANELRRKGTKVAVLSRGYGRDALQSRALLSTDPSRATVLNHGPSDPIAMPPFAGDKRSYARELGDEPLLIHLRTQAPVYVGADRVALARAAAGGGAEVALLDDGMQHRRLHRDADILVIDATVGFGNRWSLPLGPLREAPSAARRAKLVWLRTDDPSAQPPPECAGLPLVRAHHHPSQWVHADGTPHQLTELKGARVFAFAGLARPTGFVRSLEQLGAVVTGSEFFPDHHFFSEGELASLEAHARAERAVLITTEKDLMRLPEGHPATVLTQEVSILNGEAVLASLLG